MAHEATKTLVPVALVVGFGLAWVAVRPEFFWQDDFQSQYLPASREIARALSEGSLPILTQRNWFGAGLAGEFQHGVFSLSTLAASWLVWQLGLSLAGTATALSLFHLSILAAGAFRLARTRQLDLSEATLVSVIAALNGWIIFWGKTWYPSITSFAWVPWVWWALERSLGTERRALDVFLAGGFLYLVLAAGWPFTALMVALLTVCLVVRSWAVARTLLAPWPAVLAWLLALGLAAPSLMTFLEYGQATSRVASKAALDLQWMMPLEGLRGLVLPATQASWHTYMGSLVTRPSVELAGGVVPVCALLYVVLRRGGGALRGARFELVVAVLALLCAALPCVRPFQSSFRWLPLAHLALALVGASALRALRSAQSGSRFWEARPRLPLALLASALITVLMLLDASDLARQLGKVSLVLALCWAALELVGLRGLSAWPAVAFCLASLAATYHYLPPLPDAPRWVMPETMKQQAPYRADVRYLSLFDIGDLIHLVQPAGAPAYWQGAASSLRPGYTAMYADLQFSNGYSAMAPMGPARILQLGAHGEINHRRAVDLIRLEAADGGLLDLMATDGLVLVDSLLGELNVLSDAGWRTAGRIDEGTLFERRRGLSPRVRSLPSAETVMRRKDVVRRLRRDRTDGPAPVLLFGPWNAAETFATARLTNIREDRLHSRVEVAVPAGGDPALILFSRPWLPGWRATLNGQRQRVEQVDMLMPAVRLPPGARGELTLEYRPDSLVQGLWIAFTTLTLALGWLALGPHLLARLRAQAARLHSTRA